MSLKGIAQETLDILERGGFISASGKTIDFAIEQKMAEDGTKLYTPESVEKLMQQPASNEVSSYTIEVTDETTQFAAHRLVTIAGCQDLVLLNYASARNPSGGFINGAKAQEEDLARCSGLYPCQLKQPQYYEANRSQDSLLYTDHIIYSPKIPWFRKRSRELLDEYFLASAFGRWLDSPTFYGCFDRVVFAIYDSSKSKDTLQAFQRRFE